MVYKNLGWGGGVATCLKTITGVGILLGSVVFLSWNIAFPRIFIILSAGGENRHVNF